MAYQMTGPNGNIAHGKNRGRRNVASGNVRACTAIVENRKLNVLPSSEQRQI
jgi:hypothetical protein